MYYTGFADEASPAIDGQIRATKELGWSRIESRSIDGVNLTDVTDDVFDAACQKLSAAGVQINCFGSAVANWSKDPRSDEDFESSVAALRRAIPRMRRLGTKMIRAMSFVIIRDESPDSPEIEKLVFNKVRFMVRLCEEAGITYLHENCMNYGGLSHQHTLRLVDAINSPNFRLVFDTGNPVGSDRHIGLPPYSKQSSWEFYRAVRPFIDYIHIKDCKFIAETGQIFPTLEHTFPGEGHGDVRQIVKDLLSSGYDGGFSIEPHMAVVYHEGDSTSPEELRYQTYVEYGRRFMRLVDDVKTEISSTPV